MQVGLCVSAYAQALNSVEHLDSSMPSSMREPVWKSMREPV